MEEIRGRERRKKQKGLVMRMSMMMMTIDTMPMIELMKQELEIHEYFGCPIAIGVSVITVTVDDRK